MNGTNPGRILIVDDHEANIRLLTRLLEADGHEIFTASDGDEALDLVAREQPDLVLMDVMMPRVNGFEACEALKLSAMTRLIPVVLVTALQDSRDKIRGLEAGADDFITKPVNAHEVRARVRSLIRIKRYTDDLESAEAVIVSLAMTVEARDAYTEGHCQRLSCYAKSLGRVLRLPDDDISALERGGFLHDIGKVGIPDAVLLKPGDLTRDEYAVMKQHSVIGDRLCGALRSFKKVRPIVRHHHERLDGSGYPDGLTGDQIPVLAQVMGIVDVFDATTTPRPYKKAKSVGTAKRELLEESRRGWRRPELVDAFVSLVDTLQLPDLEQ